MNCDRAGSIHEKETRQQQTEVEPLVARHERVQAVAHISSAIAHSHANEAQIIRKQQPTDSEKAATNANQRPGLPSCANENASTSAQAIYRKLCPNYKGQRITIRMCNTTRDQKIRIMIRPESTYGHISQSSLAIASRDVSISTVSATP